MNQTPAERARDLIRSLDGYGNTMFARDVEKVVAALTIPANHIRTHEGKDMAVIISTPVGVWPSDEMIETNVKGCTLLYVRSTPTP